MARAIWSGAISFGMVSIPIKLYPATQDKDISFATLHSTCHTRIKHKRWCPYHEQEVDMSEIVKAYEYAKDQYVVLDESDFDQLPVPSRHTVGIQQFTDLANIDPVQYQKSFYIEPADVGVKPYYLLKQAMEQTGRVAIGKVAIRQKESLCSLRPLGDGLVMETMHWADEVRSLGELDLPAERADVTEQELSMAVMLVDQLTRPFKPEEYQDQYRAAIEQAIEAKLGAAEPVTAAPATPRGKVRDLLEALEESLAAAKAGRSDGAAEQGGAAEEEEERPKRRRARKAG